MNSRIAVTIALSAFLTLLSVNAFSGKQDMSVASVSFDDVRVGELPKGWIGGVTGKGDPHWAVVADDTAPSPPNVLAQTGYGTFPICVATDTSLSNGFIEVRFKPVSGREDQAGGLIWRYRDKDNYYIARANALEDNVTIYHTIGGRRIAFKNTSTKVASNVWHTLRVDFRDTHFTVRFDGNVALEADDSTIAGAGAVGVWTKADSVTHFDDFRYGSIDSASSNP